MKRPLAFAAAVVAFGSAAAVTTTANAATGPATPNTASCVGADVTRVTPESTPVDLGMPQNDPTVVSLIKNRGITWLADPTCTVTPARSAKAATTTQTATTATPARVKTENWAGYLAGDRNNPHANFASTTYREPSAKTNTKRALVAHWVGIGSGASVAVDPLVQDGTLADVSSSKPQAHWFWYEVYPQENIMKVSSIPVRAGDTVYVASSWTPNKGNVQAGTASFVMCNLSMKRCTNIKQRNIGRPGPQVEWITERPGYNSGYLPLANYGQVTFTNNTWDMDNRGNPVHGISGWATPVYMYNSTSKNLLAYPRSIYRQAFSTYWRASN